MKEAPEATKQILSNVNIFSDEQNMRPEPPTGLKVFDASLKFNEDELSVLAKGPKFMVRDKLSSEDFEVELEKMVVLAKYDRLFRGKDDNSEAKPSDSGNVQTSKACTPAETHGSLNTASDENGGKYKLDYVWDENSGKMVYDIRSKTLDLGNLQATK